MSSSFLASVDVIDFHTFEAYSSLGLTTVKYTINNLSVVEKEWAVVGYNKRKNFLHVFKQILRNFHKRSSVFKSEGRDKGVVRNEDEGGKREVYKE